MIYAVDWNGAWTNGPVTVYTAIFDTEIGVEKTEYSFNGGAWTAFDGSFDVTENGTFTIRAIDNAGNRSFSALYAVTNIGVSADQAPPVIYAVDWNGEPTGGPVTVYTAIFDAESGMAKTEYSFNGGEWTAFDGTFDVTENGVFTIRATDNAENEAFSEQLAITNIAAAVSDGLTAELLGDASAPFAAGSALWDADTGLAGFDGLSDWDTAAFLSDADILKFDRNGSQVNGMLA